MVSLQIVALIYELMLSIRGPIVKYASAMYKSHTILSDVWDKTNDYAIVYCK